MKNLKKTFYQVCLLMMVAAFTQCKPSKKEFVYNEGKVYGTYYHLTYDSPKGKDLKPEIEQRFREFDLSLSTFNPNSIITRVNQNDSTVQNDSYFEQMYAMAREVSEKSEGAFDITVAPLVNAWGFGYGNHEHNLSPNIDTIMPFIGYQKIKLENHRLIKEDPRIRLDASAIAKGQSCDVIARLLEEKGCENYMVEIGGEICCKGLNPKGEKWRIGIDKPKDDPANVGEELQIILQISDVGLATSGNYRQFYYKDGKKYAHTINPHTGVPVEHSLLSSTVIAPTCMQADAYATAFMVLGPEKSIQLCESIPNMECYLIYADKDGNDKIIYTKGFEKYFTK